MSQASCAERLEFGVKCAIVIHMFSMPLNHPARQKCEKFFKQRAPSFAIALIKVFLFCLSKYLNAVRVFADKSRDTE
jgi:hypothetical protein